MSRQRRGILIVAAVAVVVLAATVVAALSFVRAHQPPPHVPFQPANQTQASYYQSSYQATAKDIRDGEPADRVGRVCRLTAAMSGGDDAAIGTLSGCADALAEVPSP